MALIGIEVEGIIIKEYPAREGVSQRTGNAWKSQEFVIQTKDQYPRACQFRVFGADRLAQFNLHQGDAVHIWLNINARAWQDRYFNDIDCYQVDHIDPNSMGGTQQTSQAPVASAAPVAAPTAPASPAIDSTDDNGDLPF